MAHYLSNHVAVAYGDVFGEMVALSPGARLPGARAAAARGARVKAVADRQALSRHRRRHGQRACGVFDDERDAGLGLGVHPIQIFRPAGGLRRAVVDDIWQACGHRRARGARRRAAPAPSAIAGIGFDATCSLVALDAADRPVTVSPTGRDEQNVVVWMDHRAHRAGAPHQRHRSRRAALRGRRDLARDADAEAALAQGAAARRARRARRASSICPTF